MGLSLFSNKEGTVSQFVNPSRFIKYVFISFVQNIFAKYPEFLWEPNRKTTKIIIQDKYATSLVNNEKIPVIYFNRGTLNIYKTSIDQTLLGTSNNQYQINKTDVIRSSGSFSCLAPDPITAEHVADVTATALYVFRLMFKERGVNNINTVSVGETNPIKVTVAGNKIDQYMTPVFVNFDFQFQYLDHADFDGLLNTAIDTAINGGTDGD